jgi:hypothetical protein
MNTKIIFGASLAALFAVFMMVPVMATGPEIWQHVVSSSINSKNTQTSTLSVSAADIIPKHTDVLGGFAWIYADGPNTAIVATTHSGVRDSGQNPDGWHAHNVQLGAGGHNSDACITGLSDANVGLSIQGNTLSMNVRNSELTGTLSDKASAFTIVPDTGCSSRLGVVLS